MTSAGPVKGLLGILRHGQTDYNQQHLNTGRRDIPLNKNGEAQADALGALLKTPRIDVVFSSPLSRAFNTAQRALKASGTQSHLQNANGSWQIEKRAEIIELDAGDFTGCSNVNHPGASKPYIYDVRVPNGESIKDVVERVRKFYEAEILPRLERGENVLVSGHYFILMAFEIVLGIRGIPVSDPSKPKLRIPNASPLICEFEDGVLKSHRYIENPAANQNVPQADDNRTKAKKRKQGPKP